MNITEQIKHAAENPVPCPNRKEFPTKAEIYQYEIYCIATNKYMDQKLKENKVRALNELLQHESVLKK